MKDDDDSTSQTNNFSKGVDGLPGHLDETFKGFCYTFLTAGTALAHGCVP